ncbi:MAG: hypothetical protein K8R58_00130 [Bacteroidales bacterium]|nr:hypothetical protein [Bacteroidales bacterium]
MLLQKIIEYPSLSLNYLERYVNEGSPSGFSQKYTSSEKTNPFTGDDNVSLFVIDNRHYSIETLTIDNTCELPQNEHFFLHPDMIKHPELSDVKIEKYLDYCFAPTASARTLISKRKNADNYYVKLYYDGLIGRINRKLDRKKTIAGIEISHKIKQAIYNEILPEELGLLHEYKCNIFKTKSQTEWGCVFRNTLPIFRNNIKIAYTIPLFSLWSKDTNNVNSEILLSQLEDEWKHESQSIIVEKILEPIINIYFSLIFELGLQFEMNAQNVLIGFSKKHTPALIIIRDMMGVEKDIPIMKRKGLNIDFNSLPYKELNPDFRNIDDLWFYQVRHSFAFDFKLCKYVIEPIIMSSNIKEKYTIINHLISLVKKWEKLLPNEYFPDCWYYHDRILLDKSVKISLKQLYKSDNKPFLR